MFGGQVSRINRTLASPRVRRYSGPAMKKPANPSASLEREVIAAVVILYLGICAVMLGLHFAEPGGSATATSSTSPSTDAVAANVADPAAR